MSRAANGSNEAGADRGMPADQIDVTLFREILLLPFSIDWMDEARPGRPTGRERMAAVREILDQNKKNWTRISNRALHLPEDFNEPPQESREQRATRLRYAYGEFVYFEPYVQKYLYGAGKRTKDAMDVFARQDVDKLSVDFNWAEYNLENAESASEEIKQEVVRRYTFSVKRCNFYLFETGNALLALELEYESVVPVNALDGAPGVMWDNTKRLTLSDCQTVLENLRRVFPPHFIEVEGQGLDLPSFPRRFAWHCRDKRDNPPVFEGVNAVNHLEHVLGPQPKSESDRWEMPKAAPMIEPWCWLLNPLPIEGGSSSVATDGQPLRLGQMGDERAFVMAAIGVRDAFQIQDSDWVRIAFCDGKGSDFPYAKNFLKAFQQNHCYDRFYDDEKKVAWQATRYMICNYAMVMVGSCPSMAECPKHFYRSVLIEHFRRHYFILVMISLLHKAALLSLSERMAEALHRDDFEGEAEMVHQEVLTFTHRYWFEEISAQIQAQELFTMLRSHLRTRELYGQLSQEVREAAARLSGRRQERLNQVAGIGLGAAVFAGIFGMNVFDSSKPLLGNISHWIFWLAMIGVAALFYALYRDWRSDWRRAAYYWRRCVQRRLCKM